MYGASLTMKEMNGPNYNNIFYLLQANSPQQKIVKLFFAFTIVLNVGNNVRIQAKAKFFLLTNNVKQRLI